MKRGQKSTQQLKCARRIVYAYSLKYPGKYNYKWKNDFEIGADLQTRYSRCMYLRTCAPSIIPYTMYLCNRIMLYYLLKFINDSIEFYLR